ncbi:ankyrin repeat domain-containing protein, partial [Plastoroseomonas hellenica]
MRILPILAVPLLLAALPVFAQGLGNAPAGGPAAPRSGGQQPQRPAANSPPPALPGLAARRAPEPIPADPSRVLSPNAALFDAITRGDLPAARDAVSRGADLDARNVLGLTPVDAAVDQGRNEILFYLLSARGTARSPAPPPPEARESPRERQARER